MLLIVFPNNFITIYTIYFYDHKNEIKSVPNINIINKMFIVIKFRYVFF